MVKPGIVPEAEPLVLVPVLGVSVVHVAQTKVSAWATGIAVTAQAANISAVGGREKRFLNFIVRAP
jgi:hypothetical protein